MESNRTTIYLRLFICIITVVLVAGCQNEQYGGFQKVEKTDYIMGTIANIVVYTHDKKRAEETIEKAFERVREIEKLLSLNIENSEINVINDNAGNDWTKVHEDTYAVIHKGLYYGSVSDGLFDITIGPLVKLWTIGTSKQRIPLQEELERAKKLINYTAVEMDNNELLIKLDKKDMVLDLGGIAKGFAADEAKKVLISEDIKNAIVNLGGNITTLGTRFNGENWKIGIQDPFEKRGISMGKVNLEDKAVVTSGDYERYFEENGKRYHHILNPKTGYPADNGVKSVTVIADSSFDADALSTTLFLMGIEKGVKLAEELQGVEAIFITKDKKVILTSGIKDILDIYNKEYRIGEHN